MTSQGTPIWRFAQNHAAVDLTSRGWEEQGQSSYSSFISLILQPGTQRKLTGKTNGMPPRTAFEPSRTALELKKRFSAPFADFHEVMVAPCRSTSMDSPVGKLAVTLALSSEMDTCGVGITGDTGIAVGFFERSIGKPSDGAVDPRRCEDKLWKVISRDL